MTASLSGTDYQGEDMIEFLKKKIVKCYVIDGENICSECGSPKVLNVALVGAMGKCNALGLSVQDIEKVLQQKLKPQFLAMNKKALELGAQCV